MPSEEDGEEEQGAEQKLADNKNPEGAIALLENLVGGRLQVHIIVARDQRLPNRCGCWRPRRFGCLNYSVGSEPCFG